MNPSAGDPFDQRPSDPTTGHRERSAALRGGAAPAALRADVRLRIGTLDLDVQLDLAPGSTLAVLGPNGAGKSTLLRALAGLRPIESGCIALGGRTLDDPERDVLVPTEQRPISVVFQDYLLFAHLSALENVAFGLRARGTPRRQALAVARSWLERLDLEGAAERKPAALSGGQQQRVALARALATDPELLLLDEPLAALDAATRTQVRHDLRSHLAGYRGIRVLVTHDPLDAYALADRVVVIEHGRIVQAGTLAAIAARPRTRYVAQLVGTNLLRGVVRGTTFTSEGGGTLHVDGATTGEAYLAVAPSAIALYHRPPEGTPRNVWRTTVAGIEPAFDRARVTLGPPLALTAEVTTAGLAALDRHPGQEVWASVKATELQTYPA
jgi:molybdate transport system ATP-binding protein